jgi:UDP-2,4-diacetamido-2,4,6-trideoxy-beta-L-altropyranose hydrolase
VQVLIRTDATEAIGQGHFSRCASLAAALRLEGAAVTLVSASLPPALQAAARARGITPIALAGDGAASPGAVEAPHSRAAQESDARAVIAALPAARFDWVVVDHYRLGAPWEARMRSIAPQIAVIDDLANRAHSCDVLLDQNLRSDQGLAYDGLLGAGCERRLGPRHALLDASFAAARAAGDSVGRDGILLSFGSADASGYTLPVLRALLALPLDAALRIDVVAGGLNPRAAAIRDFCQGELRTRFHHDTADMAGLLRRAVLYIGAGGSSSWERCCLGVPGIVVAASPNQEAVCAALAEAGSHRYLGPAAAVAPEAMAHAAASLLAEHAQRDRQSKISRGLVDGLGARRMAARMARGTVALRPAGPDDAARVLEWRNHPEVRRHSADGAAISAADHRTWFARVLQDKSRDLLIGEDRLGPLGVLRYDVAADSANVSIYLVPQRIGKGAGAALLASGERWLARQRGTLAEITATVEPANGASIRMFEEAGYRRRDRQYVKRIPLDRQP